MSSLSPIRKGLSQEYKQFLSFLLVGGVNTLVGFLLYSTLIFLGVQYNLAIVVSHFLGVIFNFFSYGKIVFRNIEKGAFLKFVSSYALGLICNLLVFKFLITVPFLNAYSAQFISLSFVVGLLFIVNKFWVFKS